MQNAPCPTARELAVGAPSTAVTASSASDALGLELVDVLLRRGLTHPDSFTALNNLLCAIAEEHDPARAAAALRPLRTRRGQSSVIGPRPRCGWPRTLRPSPG